MMRERRVRNLKLFPYVADNEPVGVGRQQALHDAQTRLGPHRREHVGEARDFLGVVSGRHIDISKNIEILEPCQVLRLADVRPVV